MYRRARCSSSMDPPRNSRPGPALRRSYFLLSNGPHGGLRAAEQRVQRAALGDAQSRQEPDHPLLVGGGHRVERMLSLARELHGKCPSVAGDRPAPDESFFDELIGESGDIASRHHQPLRQLAHLEAVRIALELRQQIESRQRSIEIATEADPDRALDELRAREKPKPEAKRVVMRI